MNRKLKLLLLGTPALAALGACGGGVYVVGPPPPPRAVVMGVAPGPGFVWTDGYWAWRGGSWAWAPGAWLRPPRPGAVWMAPRYVPYGRRYRFVRGYWR
ncbi:MAG: YXWGXW repeat-containing protein [Bryobacteraceae bacterium]|jgi:hypothetical protein